MIPMDYKLPLLAVLLMPLMVAASTVNLPNSTSVGYSYPFSAAIDGVNFRTPCTLNAVDAYGTPSKSWGTDANGFLLTTDRNGSLVSYVNIDNSFVIDSTYQFQLLCGTYKSPIQNVTVIVGGSSTWNIGLLNGLDWANTRPDEAMLAALIVIILIVVGGAAYSSFRSKSPWF